MRTDMILVVEDDPRHSAIIRDSILGRYPDVVVGIIETERDFRACADVLRDQGVTPLMIICGVMLPWAFPEDDAGEIPVEVIQGTFRKAGIRCWKYFRQELQFQHVPWIYFTVLDDGTIGFAQHSDHLTGYVQKAGSIKPLFDEMEQLLELSGPWESTEAEVTAQLMAFPEMARRLRQGMWEFVGDDVSALGLPS